MTLAATFLRMAVKYGHSHTLRRVTKGEYDPEIGTAAETFTDEVVAAIPLRPGSFQMAGSLIVRDKAGVLIPALKDDGTLRDPPTSDDRVVDSLTGNESEIGAIDALIIKGGPIGWACDLGR
jgi:hypothetical protein